MGKRAVLALAAAGAIFCGLAAPAAAEEGCSGPMRKLNVSISVTPPNVVHTPPFVAKALGYFAKHCIDANLMQFEGGASASAVAAVAQGTTFGPLAEAAIAQGLKGKQIWTQAVKPPHDYFVSERIQSFADLKGKRLSAAGGVGAFNWLMGREVLRHAGYSVDDVQFISQGTAGRLPGLLTGQLDGVALHPEDAYLATKKKPGTHSLVALSDLLPHYEYLTYGAADALIARDRTLIRDAVAALIEANRTIYRDKEKVIPIIMEATQKPRDAVEYAWDYLTKRCIWSVNQGLEKERADWTMQYWVDVGDVEPSRKLRYDQMVDASLAKDALAAVGGPVTINSCKD
jgi:ABC-type nitrate/sulfonate/bicarbonate transport system substrate-binding protein